LSDERQTHGGGLRPRFLSNFDDPGAAGSIFHAILSRKSARLNFDESNARQIGFHCGAARPKKQIARRYISRIAPENARSVRRYLFVLLVGLIGFLLRKDAGRTQDHQADHEHDRPSILS
jgi:hypothetical protein